MQIVFCFVDSFEGFGGLYADMLERVVKKTGAEAHTEIVSFKYGVVPAALAALPELRIVGKFGERYGPESEFVVYFMTAAPVVMLNILAYG